MTPTRRIDKSLIYTIVGGILAAGMWAGRVEYQMQRIAELEKQAHEAGVMVAQWKFMWLYGGLPKK